jgi:hypothetical protein
MQQFAAVRTREIYRSSNEDRWLLARDPETGRVFVRHEPASRSPCLQPGMLDSMICHAIHAARSKRPIKNGKHPRSPTVLLSCQIGLTASSSRIPKSLSGF